VKNKKEGPKRKKMIEIIYHTGVKRNKLGKDYTKIKIEMLYPIKSIRLSASFKRRPNLELC